MMSIKTMQDNIINVFGMEHPNTIDFFNLCEHFGTFNGLIYKEYKRIMATKKMVTNDYECSHIHIFVMNGITDEIIKSAVIEFNNKPFKSYVEIVKDIENAILTDDDKNNYIFIHNIIIQ